MNCHDRRLERSLPGRQTLSEQNGGNLATSRQRLARLLRKARLTLALQGSASQMLERGSELFDVTVPYGREDNLDRIEIYPAARGRWHADLVLRSVPIGVPSIIGTDIATAPRTRKAAEQIALQLLVHVLAADEIYPDRVPCGRAVLMVNGRPFYASLEELAEREASPGYRRLTQAEALAQLDQVTNTRVSKGKAVGWALDALIAGVVRYPATVGGAPKCEVGSRTH